MKNFIKPFFISLIIVILFSLFSNVVLSKNIGDLSDKVADIFLEEDYNIYREQEIEFQNNKKYKYISKYKCGDYECRVHEYLMPPYTDNDRGYILIIETEDEMIYSKYGKIEQVIINDKYSSSSEDIIL